LSTTAVAAHLAVVTCRVLNRRQSGNHDSPRQNIWTSVQKIRKLNPTLSTSNLLEENRPRRTNSHSEDKNTVLCINRMFSDDAADCCETNQLNLPN